MSDCHDDLPEIGSAGAGVPRHSALVRVTHWINAGCFVAQVVSGLAILLAYPRMHWGETGSLGVPSLFDLPLPFVLDWGIRGPGRYVHFLTAWIFVTNGVVYLVSGLRTRHFRDEILPKRSDLAPRPVAKAVAQHLRRREPADFETYNIVQQIAYFAVIFVLLPFMFFSGVAMSPAVTSVLPVLVDVFGGQQSARTLHFLAACLLVVFFLVHLAMVLVSGFSRRLRGMITGYPGARRKPA